MIGYHLFKRKRRKTNIDILLCTFCVLYTFLLAQYLVSRFFFSLASASYVLENLEMSLVNIKRTIIDWIEKLTNACMTFISASYSDSMELNRTTLCIVSSYIFNLRTIAMILNRRGNGILGTYVSY